MTRRISTSSPRPTRGRSSTGATVELAKGGHVTPLAQDTLRERRVTVVPAGSVDPALPADLAPRSDIRRVAIASDHTGGAMRTAIVQHLRGRGLAVDDLGVDEHDAGRLSRYRGARRQGGRARRSLTPGIVIDGAGIGSAIAANKVRGIRAAMITDETIARYAREHNGTNVMTLGSTLRAARRRRPPRRYLARDRDDRGAIYSETAEDSAARGPSNGPRTSSRRRTSMLNPTICSGWSRSSPKR